MTSTDGRDLSLDVSTANPARIYDYFLGGTMNFEADRRAGDRLMRAKPLLRPNALANRAFQRRVVHHLAAGEGVTQFLDIGAGIPAPGLDQTHEVAQAANPSARVVYVDIDPVVLVQGRALLTRTSPGTVDYVQADLLDPGAILDLAGATLDFSKPAAVMLLAILHMAQDAARHHAIVARLMDAMAPGSFLAISHPASDRHAAESAAGAAAYERFTGIRQTNRPRGEVARFFAGLDILDPGIVQANEWRPGPGDDTSEELSVWCALGRKPPPPGSP